MNVFDKLRTIVLAAHIRLTWSRHDSTYEFKLPGYPKFMSIRDAVKLIPDGATLATSGLGANQRPSIVYWVIREAFESAGHPCNLTVVSIGGQGARGRAPGSIEEIFRKGLCRRLFAGHFETFKTALRVAEQGEMELQCLPQGVLAQMIDAQGRGEDSFLTKVGVNTFLDPRTGHGTPLAGENAEQMATVEDGKLRFRMPKITVAVFNGYAADKDGNIYITHCPMKAEMLEISRAAKKNNGLVIANVSRLVEKGFDDIYIPGDLVDAIVVHPHTEQTGFIPYHSHFSFLTPKGTVSADEGLARARFINHLMGLTPRRTAIDEVIARLAADVFVRNVPKGSLVNIGVGMPEEVCRVLHDAKLLEDVTLFTESGVIGGVPAPGFFFGSAIRPEKIISSAATFAMCPEKLAVTLLGVLQADSDGNVNVSKRTDKLSDYVGPGGFIDLTSAARTIIFITKWMEGAKVSMEGGRVKITKPGKPKFVAKVDEITMNGQEALKAGKNVFYVTTVGLFQLTRRGMELIRVMPGVDIEKDILATTSMKVVLPENGKVPLVDESILTGKGFQPKMESSKT